MKDVGDRGVSAKSIERVVPDGVGLAERRDVDPKTDDALAQRPQTPPEWTSWSTMDRICIREPRHGPGVHRTREAGTRPERFGSIRGSRTLSDQDPQPETPTWFCDPKHVATIAKTAR